MSVPNLSGTDGISLGAPNTLFKSYLENPQIGEFFGYLGTSQNLWIIHLEDTWLPVFEYLSNLKLLLSKVTCKSFLEL